jgi:release factor glutamine methyltransferase
MYDIVRAKNRIKELVIKHAMINFRQRLSSFIVKILQRCGPHKVSISGNTYIITRDVFNPRFYGTSEFMAGKMNVKPEDDVLDVGTGSGIQAITAGRIARKVVAVDINPEAVRCAAENVKRHGLSNISVFQGDLFTPFDKHEKFDVILFTPPYFNGKPETALDHSLYDPGKKLAKRFFREARNFLKPGGNVQMVYSSMAEPERVLDIAEESGWQYSIIAERKMSFETFYIYKLTTKQYT